MTSLDYTTEPEQFIDINGQQISSFIKNWGNADSSTVKAFGDEWNKFKKFTKEEISLCGNEYFDILVDSDYGINKRVLDAGCGSGRWSIYLADRFGYIEAIDPSSAVIAAVNQIREHGKNNVRVTQAEINSLPFKEGSFDVVVCLGVLHHIPDTIASLKALVQMLKPGGLIVLYMYYALDNRGPLFKALFKFSVGVRNAVSRMPSRLKLLVCDVLAVLLYMPFVLLARALKVIAPKSKVWQAIPLSYYVNKSWFIIRNDALDRFGTPLEKRYTKKELIKMLEEVGMQGIEFSNGLPYWHLKAYKTNL
jgi:SAM-dependent methyltransferase